MKSAIAKLRNQMELTVFFSQKYDKPISNETHNKGGKENKKKDLKACKSLMLHCDVMRCVSGHVFSFKQRENTVRDDFGSVSEENKCFSCHM